MGYCIHSKERERKEMNRFVKITGVIAVTFLMALPMCYQACKNKLFVFDESYYFIQAYELGEHGRFFIDFDPTVKLRNTKPYLFSAVQILLGKTIGWNEWSLRLPVIACAIALVWLIFIFIQKIFNNTLWALCSATLLLVMPYYICPHMAFTGDHDVPLIFFTTAFILFFYLFLTATDTKKENVHIVYICAAATASILIKGWMIVFFLPFCLLFLFVFKKQKRLFFNKNFWISITFVFTALAAWYLGREYVDPGYLDAVWKYEIGRYNGIQSVNPEWEYYWRMLFYEQVQYWLLFLVVVVYMLLIDKTLPYRAFLYYIITVSTGFLFILSFSNVKLLWYDAAVLPLMSIVLGAGISYSIRYISARIFDDKEWMMFVLYALAFIFFYIQIFYRNFSRALPEEYGTFMMHKHTNESYTVVPTKYNPHVLFYNQLSQKRFDVTHPIKTKHAAFQASEKMLVCEPFVMLEIDRKYEYIVLDSTRSCTLIEIKKSR